MTAATRRVIFLNRYYAPDHSATSQYLTDLAEYLATEGWQVRVICSRQLYEDAAAELPSAENINGVDVQRVAGSRFGRDRLLGRAFDYLAFYLAASWCLFTNLRPHTLVVAKTDPPLLSVPVSVIARLRGARQVNWLQDLFPEVASGLGLGLAKGLPGAIIRFFRNRSLKKSHTNVVIGEQMHQRLLQQSIAADKVAVIPNWADTVGIQPIAHEHNSRRDRWQLGGKFVLCYSGNLGRAHDLLPLIDAFGRLPAERFELLIIGGGPGKAALQALVAGRGLPNVQWQPYQPRAELSESLSVADLHIVSLKPELEGLIVPSKFAGALAAGRPVLFFGDNQGQLAQWLKAWDCGWVAAADSQALARSIEQLANDTDRQLRLGGNARRAAESQLGRQLLLARWSNVLAGALASNKD